MKKIIAFAILVLSALLTGCASQEKNLAAGDWKVAHGRDVVVVVSEAEAGIHVDQTNVQPLQQTGLLGGLVAGVVDVTIDSIQAHRGEAAIAPIRDALIDYDFGGKALGEVKRQMDKAPWFNFRKAMLTKDGTSQNFSKLVDESTASQVLFVCMRYDFSPNLKTLRVGLNAVILKRMVPSTHTDSTCDQVASRKALYYHRWFYRDNLYLARDAASNARLWAEDKGVRVRSGVESGMTELIRELMIDLYQVPAEPEDDSSSATATQPPGAAGGQATNSASMQLGRRGPVSP